MIHLQNSAAVMNYNCEIATHMRVGMLTYGLQEVGYFDPKLKASVFFRRADSCVRDIEDHKYVAYELKDDLDIEGCRYLAKIKNRIW